MPAPDTDQLRSIKSFPALVKYLREELGWPIDGAEVEDLTFDYTADELGLDAKHAARVKEIKQLRPLETNQPWGIFWVSFEKKKLPMVVLRRILGNLVTKSRASESKTTRPTWQLHDLLFISSYGEEEHRNISFAHFSESDNGQLPILKVLGWDDQNSIMHLDRVANRLQTNLRWPSKPGDLAMWRVRWSDAFTERYGEAIESADVLIPQLAALAANIRKRARDVLEAESDRGPLRKLFAAIHGLLIHDMSEDQFADMYAQTVSYGLLSTSFSRPAGINPENLIQLTKITNPFLENLLESLFRLNRGKFHFDVDEVGINDVLDLLRATNIEAIKAAFNDQNPAEDPVIRFYEGFLREYDSEQRIKRGVFFTPRPVVSYIVRSVHELLQTEFGLEDGLASTATWANVAASMERRRVLEAQKQPVVSSPSPSSQGGEGRLVAPQADGGGGEGKRKPSQTEFKIPDGVSPSDPFVCILDIATGTATFLNECIEVIERTMKTKWARELGLVRPLPSRGSPLPSDGRGLRGEGASGGEGGTRYFRHPEILARWRDYVPTHLLPRLHGFEIMMAPYAIAHLKLALKLGETGYQFREGDRLHIYLTNTLEPPSDIADAKLADLFGPLAREAQEVNHVKRTKRFTVVIGNPPYAYESVNSGPWISSLISDYMRVDGKGLEERNPRGLQDDYVKFLRLTQFSIDQTGCGIVGLITNHGFLSNPTFRGMRQHLLRSFDKVFTYDLHGNANRVERAPDGSIDENVFDILQGVSILCTVRGCAPGMPERVAQADLFGTREFKYAQLIRGTVQTTRWKSSTPSSPFYLFVSREMSLQAEYDRACSLVDVFGLNSVGVSTSRDSLCVQFTAREMIDTVKTFASLPAKQAREQYCLGPDVAEWSVALAQKDLNETKLREELVARFLYRPFDLRFTYYTGSSRGFHSRPRPEVMRHMLSRANLGLCTNRQVNNEFRHAFVTRAITEGNAVSLASRERTYLFPLYLMPRFGPTTGLNLNAEAKSPNFQPAFMKAFAEALRLSKDEFGFPHGLTPEDIFHYAYAVFHSPSYRSRYAEFLKIDFPRLPLTGNLELFRALARLGGELVALHLLESTKLDKPISEFIRPSPQPSPRGRGSEVEVEKVWWSKNTVWLDKAQTTGFRGVREDVWNFHIGGYQVCEKWLKDRKGRKLTKDDLAHYQKIVVALSETIRLMAEIDVVIEKHGGWPLK